MLVTLFGQCPLCHALVARKAENRASSSGPLPQHYGLGCRQGSTGSSPRHHSIETDRSQISRAGGQKHQTRGMRAGSICQADPVPSCWKLDLTSQCGRPSWSPAGRQTNRAQAFSAPSRLTEGDYRIYQAGAGRDEIDVFRGPPPDHWRRDRAGRARRMSIG